MAEVKNWMALAEPDPEWEQAVKETMGGQAPNLGMFPDIASMRKWISDAKQAMSEQMGPEIKGVKEKDHEVTMRDGHKITCRVYAPESPPAGGSPLVVLYHGGGWCIGGLENEELLCRRITATYGAVSVNIDYRLAPEHKFPIPLYDSYDATKWAASNASSLGADPSKGFVIGGTSAGGGLTSVISHLWRDEKIKPAITGCLLVIPSYCYSTYVPEKYKKDYKSYDQNKEAPILSREAINLFLDNYIPNDEDRKSQLFSSLLWEGGHGNLPASAFQICGQDPLRDEALIFERILREEHGTPTKTYVYPGLPHGFHSVAPGMKASQQFIQDSEEAIGWLLSRG